MATITDFYRCCLSRILAWHGHALLSLTTHCIVSPTRAYCFYHRRISTCFHADHRCILQILAPQLDPSAICQRTPSLYLCSCPAQNLENERLYCGADWLTIWILGVDLVICSQYSVVIAFLPDHAANREAYHHSCHKTVNHWISIFI